MKIITIFLLFSIIFPSSLKAQHTLILKSGNKLNGVVLGIEMDVLSFYVNRKLEKYDLKEVSTIFFNEYVPYDGSFDPKEEEKTIKSGDYFVKYQMKNRIMTTPPKLSNATENKGRVVVDVTIDRYGIVKSVKAGAPGSTTSNEYLYIKAEFAVKGVRFNEHKTGPLNTKGVVIIDY